MGVKDLRRRMILAPTLREREREREWWYAILLLAQGLTAAATLVLWNDTFRSPAASIRCLSGRS